MAKAFGPYSPMRLAGEFLYVSGQVGIDHESNVAPVDVSSQSLITLKNLERVLQEVDASLDDVIKVTIFLTDMTDFARVNEVYEQHFSPPRPARSCVAVKELPRVAGDTKLLVEIEAIAYKKQKTMNKEQ